MFNCFPPKMKKEKGVGRGFFRWGRKKKKKESVTKSIFRLKQGGEVGEERCYEEIN